jgi:acyl carrier protein
VSASLSDEIKSLIAEITELEVGAIAEDSHLVMDLGADSMAALELMAALEKKYNIVIDPEFLPEMHSLASITDLVERVKGSG